MKPLVTKDSLRESLDSPLSPVTLADGSQLIGHTKIQYIVGRALAAIYKRQTDEEKNQSAATKRNGIGFSKSDARTGSIGARMFNHRFSEYQKTKNDALLINLLDPWLVIIWSAVDKTGYPRICRYAGQLNEIAKEKAGRTITVKAEPAQGDVFQKGCFRIDTYNSGTHLNNH